MKRILIATDGSASAREAVAFGIGMAAEQNADAFVVHVVRAFDIVGASAFCMPSALPHRGVGAPVEKPVAAIG